MRTKGFLFVLLLVVLTMFPAAATGQAQQAPATSLPQGVFQFQAPSGDALIGPLHREQLPQSDSPHGGQKSPPVFVWRDDLPALNRGCLTMRTYKVERESSHSDATRPAGYATCIPASSFQVKSVPWKLNRQTGAAGR
jgi:hypothetical protein